jgi:hypothetical protein
MLMVVLMVVVVMMVVVLVVVLVLVLVSTLGTRVREAQAAFGVPSGGMLLF